jgi:hypothetical protein
MFKNLQTPPFNNIIFIVLLLVGVIPLCWAGIHVIVEPHHHPYYDKVNNIIYYQGVVLEISDLNKNGDCKLLCKCSGNQVTMSVESDKFRVISIEEL